MDQVIAYEANGPEVTRERFHYSVGARIKGLAVDEEAGRVVSWSQFVGEVGVWDSAAKTTRTLRLESHKPMVASVVLGRNAFHHASPADE